MGVVHKYREVVAEVVGFLDDTRSIILHLRVEHEERNVSTLEFVSKRLQCVHPVAHDVATIALDEDYDGLLEYCQELADLTKMDSPPESHEKCTFCKDFDKNVKFR